MNEPRDPIPIQPAVPAPLPAPVPGPEVTEDSVAQALSEALRSSFLVVKILMVLVVAWFLGSGIFTVGPQEKAVKLRFGKPVGEGENALLGPGLHFAFPAPIDEVVRIPVGEVQTVSSTIGWYETTAAKAAAGTEPPPDPALNPARDGYLLTADRNIVHVRGDLRYHISEPGLSYTFNFVAASNLVQNAFNNALLYATAQYSVDNILKADVAGYRELVRLRLGKLLEQQRLGVVVDQLELKAIPPRQLAADFNAVTDAGLQSSKAVNEANQYANQKVSAAKAEKEARLNSAKAEKSRLVDFVGAEAKLFTDLLPQYRSNPELFVQQRQTETLKRVMANVQDKWVLPQAGDTPAELRLQLNPEPAKPKPAPTSPATP